MSKKTAALLLAVLMLISCLPALADEPVITVTDMYDREITLNEPATRIVAMQPSDCEILCAIGCEDALVGIGQYCDYPASITSLPVVQSGNETNIEEILALNPQVVLMNDMSQSEEQVQQLEQNGVKVVISKATDIEGVYYAIRMVLFCDLVNISFSAVYLLHVHLSRALAPVNIMPANLQQCILIAI